MENITDAQYLEYKNFWTLIKIFEDPKEISNKTIAGYCGDFTIPARIITPGYIREKKEDPTEEGEEVIVRIDTGDYFYVNREFYSIKNQSNLMKVLCQIEYFFNKF